jgi:DNA-binding NarL/FixJ family response regulator
MITVLLIDSHQITSMGLKHLIEAAGNLFKVCAIAHSENEAWGYLETHSPDVIILEPDLDGGDGFALIPRLLQKTTARLIVLTALKDPASHDRAIVAGARGILRKSDPHENLLKAITKIHEGELWINRDATSRILMQIAQANIPKKINTEEKRLGSLTAKELNAINEIQKSSEKTLKEIATSLHISEHTLRNHLASIYQKLGVRNRLELYVFCNKHHKELV